MKSNLYVKRVFSSTPRPTAAYSLMTFINYCHSHPEYRIIYELNNHPYHESYKCRDGSVREIDGNGYLMIDFSPDFGEHGFDDGTFAVVSCDFRFEHCYSIDVRNPVNLFVVLYDLFIHGKLAEAYVESY